MDTIFISSVPVSRGANAIQKLYASDAILAAGSFDQYVLLKLSENVKLLCKFVPQLNSTGELAFCDPSVVIRAPNGLIDPSTVKLETFIKKEHIEPICVADATRVTVSVVFKDVKHQNVWSKDMIRLAKAVKHILRLFVVQSGCLVNLNRLGLKQNFNVDLLLVLKTDCQIEAAAAARITPETSVDVVETMSSLQYYHAEIGLEVKPLFSMEPQVTHLKNIIKAARNGSSRLCNMILMIGGPGSGKTSLVEHVAASLKCILFHFMSADFINADPGSTETVIRNLFKQARLLVEQNTENVCIIMLVKAESMLNCKSVNAKRISAQIQDCLTSVENCCRIIVVATTSKPYLIDPSFKQGSRFSYEVYIDVPSQTDRVKLIRGFCGIFNVNVEHSVALSLAKLTPGYTPADLELVFNKISNEPTIILELENGVLNSAISVITRHPASSLKSGIGQVITNSDLCSTTNLAGLTNVKLIFDICIKWPLMHPKVFEYFSVPPPKGVLLYGPPGCGKTSLVRSIASSSQLNVLTAMASELYSPYLGVTEANISQLFQRARANIPAVLFIDELDSLVSCRTEEKNNSSGSDDRVLSTFLIEMDGINNNIFNNGRGIVVVAATNRPDKIDAALLRPGRFDRQIYVPPPLKAEERFDILHAIVNNPDQSMPISDSSILKEIAQITEWFSPADLASLVKEAGLSCLTKDGIESFTSVKKEHFEEALTNIKPSLSKKQTLWYSKFSCRKQLQRLRKVV